MYIFQSDLLNNDLTVELEANFLVHVSNMKYDDLNS